MFEASKSRSISKQRHGLISIIIATLIGIIGCGNGDDDQDGTIFTSSFFGLSLGSQWIYHRSNVENVEEDAFVINVTGTIVDDSGSEWIYFRYIWPIPAGINAAPTLTSIDTAYTYNNSAGWLHVDLLSWLGPELIQELGQKEPGFVKKVDTVPDAKLITIILPPILKEGMTWKPRETDSDVGFANIAKIIATDQTVSVIAGKFDDVIVVRYGDENLYQEHYYAQGIGTIKRIEYAGSPFLTEPRFVVYELASYRMGF